ATFALKAGLCIRRVRFVMFAPDLRQHRRCQAGKPLIELSEFPEPALWEVRSITRQGVYFNPSNQVGSGRKFNEEGFQSKMSGIKGFILCDIVGFPLVDVYVVPVENVLRWHQAQSLGANAKVSREKFLRDMVRDIRD
ncbi:MAG: hypothetical protein NTY94_24080, partial [Alphaproteobacteria bacterium]|nr:hypothetical protein [Alphaproteobacteria bacterium]